MKSQPNRQAVQLRLQMVAGARFVPSGAKGKQNEVERYVISNCPCLKNARQRASTEQ